MRKIILAVLGLLFILGAIALGNYFIEKNQKPKPKFRKKVNTVFVQNVQNSSVPIVLSANGNLVAKNKIDIFSEVQGVLTIYMWRKCDVNHCFISNCNLLFSNNHTKVVRHC